VILDVLMWVAIADGAAAVVLAGTVYAIGRRSRGEVTVARAIGLALLLGSPASILYFVAWLVAHVSIPG
jgi:hypothetical protein